MLEGRNPLVSYLRACQWNHKVLSHTKDGNYVRQHQELSFESFALSQCSNFPTSCPLYRKQIKLLPKMATFGQAVLCTESQSNYCRKIWQHLDKSSSNMEANIWQKTLNKSCQFWQLNIALTWDLLSAYMPVTYHIFISVWALTLKLNPSALSGLISRLMTLTMPTH